jgi:hypothetical protein
MNSVTYTIDLKQNYDINEYIDFIQNKFENIIFIGNDQYELKISFAKKLSNKEEELFFKMIYEYNG